MRLLEQLLPYLLVGANLANLSEGSRHSYFARGFIRNFLNELPLILSITLRC